MMKKAILTAGFVLTAIAGFSQERYYTKEALVNFYCDGSAEKIEAFNQKGFCVVDAATGKIEFSVLMKAFTFEKALMQEHFNENYVESDKFPKAVFKGNIQNPESVKWTADGTYNVKISGQMTLHGVSKEMVTDAAILVKAGKIKGDATFILTLADYNITIPKIVEDKVSKDVRITVDAPLVPYQKP